MVVGAKQELAVAFQSMSGRWFSATAYTAGPESTGKTAAHHAFGITRSGTRATEGRTIAVDPAVVPLGSLVYIEGMGLRRAEDTGGKIRGARIDIYMEDLDQALHFGVQRLLLQVLTAVT